jgi:hypothetical protein
MAKERRSSGNPAISVIGAYDKAYEQDARADAGTEMPLRHSIHERRLSRAGSEPVRALNGG